MPTSPHPDKNPKTNSLNKKITTAETISNNPTTTPPTSTSSPAQSVARPLDSPTSPPLDRFTAHASHLHQRPVSSRSNSNVVISSTLPTEEHHHHHGANTGFQELQRPAGPHPHAPSSSSSASSSSLSVRSFQAQARNVVASLTGFGSAASPVGVSGVEDGNVNGAQIHQQAHGQSQSEMMAIAEARLFTQQLMQQQMQNQDLRRTSLTESSGRSLFGSVLGRGAAASTIGGGGGTGTGTGGTETGSGGHSSPVLGGDDPSEQTLLLARPLWVQDQDAAACRICTRTFNAVRRKHHCRQCGHIFCHDCSSRSIALPQLGYTKAVRVCNDCFEVAYLVAYCLSDDLGTSTQIHGARGLYELIETNDVKVLQSVLGYGGLDAMIYLCGSAHGCELHALATNSLAVLSENQSIQGIIVAKRAMPTLFHLAMVYAQNAASPPRPPSPPMSLVRMASNLSLHTKSIKRIETVVVILINITHIVYQMVPNKILASQLVKEGAMDSLMGLCVYFPSGVRSRAMEKAIRSIAQEHTRNGSDNTEYPESEDVNRSPSPSPGAVDDGEPGLIAMDDMYHDRLEGMQGVAAKCISVMAAEAANQSFIVDDPERIDRLVQLLYSNNADVVKYASKTMAYLSLRNDKYKPDIVKGFGASALLSVIRMATGEHFQLETGQGASQAYSEAVSHACCALANLATNTESQEILMSQLDLINTTCSVVGIFPHQREVERHVARLIANLALYDQNKLSLLTAFTLTDANETSPQLTHTLPHRYSSPPPPPVRRAKGNVIPTLLKIGALTLEWAGNPEEQEADRSYPYQGQDVIDFMNDDGTHSENPGYLTPNDSSSENEPSHQGGGEATGDQVEGGELIEWVTIRGMEDVQRHIIRAIDNLMTLVMEDPASHQSFKVFSRIWPTLGLIKAIQMANQDEDTQRRATHVMTTLIQQQQIHAETIAAMKEQREETESKRSVDHSEERQKIREEEEERVKQEKAKKQEKKRLSEEEQARAKEEEAKVAKAKEEAKVAKAKEEEEDEEAKARAKEEEEAKAIAQARHEAKEAKARAAAEAAQAAKEAKVDEEKARAEKERQIREAVELKKAEREKEKQEKLRQQAEDHQRMEQEKAAKEQRKQERRAERERLEKERLEQECLEQERLEQKRLENARIKKERLEQERLEKMRLEQERLENERVENERLEQERLEKERLEEEEREQERIENERIEQERLKEETRLEQEHLEQERLEQEQLERERIEEERIEQERIEQELLEQERLEQELLEYQRLEEERVAKEKQEQESLTELADQSVLSSSSMLSEEAPRRSSSKTLSSSEDQLSVDEAPHPAEKASKKPKKKKGRK